MQKSPYATGECVGSPYAILAESDYPLISKMGGGFSHAAFKSKLILLETSLRQNL
jgi:hypothetical protein